MITFLFIVITSILFMLISWDIFNRGIKTVALSVFWNFTYIYFLTYFLNPFLTHINKNLVYSDANKADEIYSIYTIILAFIFWIIFSISYFKENSTLNLNLSLNLSEIKLFIFSLLSFLLFIFIYHNQIYNMLIFKSPMNIFTFSNGKGLIILLGSLPIYAFLFYLTFFYIKNFKTIKYKLLHLFSFLLTSAGLFLYATVLLTRRAIGLLGLGIYLLITLKSNKKIFYYFLLALILLLPLFAVLFSTIRAIFYTKYPLNALILQGITQLQQFIVFTFEGHWLSIYISKTGLKSILLGKNPFILVENLINYIPRFIWNNKPYDLGILEIQKYLVPHTFNKEGMPKVTYPSTILVELIYSFGLVGGAIVMFFIGKMFRILENLFHKYNNNAIIVFIYFYFYIYMFNFVRGGSSFLVNMLIPLFFLALIIDWKGLKFLRRKR